MKGLREWLVNTYNGLYVIVLKPHMPTFVTVLAVVLAFVFGLIWAYGIAPTIYYDGAPYQLNQSARDQWLRMVAVSYSAGAYDEETTRSLLSQVEDPAENIQRLIQTETGVVQAALQDVQRLAFNPDGTVLQGRPAPEPEGILSQIAPAIIGVIVVIIAALILSPIWRLLIRPNIVDGVYEAVRPKSEADRDRIEQARQEKALIRERREREAALRQETAGAAPTNPYGAPIIQKLSIYTKGRQYDDSFAIEDVDNNFYGECGATVARTIGDTNELAAIEVWLFDKEDFVRTVNAIFVSEHAFTDPAIRAELENKVENPRRDIKVLRPGEVLILETNTLILQAKVVDVNYGGSPALPPNSYFDGLTVQMEAYFKGSAGVGAPAAATQAGTAYAPPPMPQSPTPSYTPPMPSPTQQPPPYTPPMPSSNPPGTGPLQPPPQQPVPPPRRRPEDDDPFGGTGDFTPIGRD
jgi:hypothetical protein